MARLSNEMSEISIFPIYLLLAGIADYIYMNLLLVNVYSNWTLQFRNFNWLERLHRKSRAAAQNKVHRSPTSWFFLWFSYDFDVTRNSSSNADAMVLASARLRGIHPPDIIQNGGHPEGGMPLKRALARTMASVFWWWIMACQRGTGYSSRPSVCLILWPQVRLLSKSLQLYFS